MPVGINKSQGYVL